MNDILLLFAISFLSSTLLPGGSEVLLSWLVLKSNNPILLLLFIASIGNTLGGFTNWMIGSYIHCSWLLKLKPASSSRYYLIAEKWITKWGIYTLLMSWLPLVGDLFCLIAGIYKIHWFKSIVFIFIGKSIRYSILIYLLNGIKI